MKKILNANCSGCTDEFLSVCLVSQDRGDCSIGKYLLFKINYSNTNSYDQAFEKVDPASPTRDHQVNWAIFPLRFSYWWLCIEVHKPRNGVRDPRKIACWRELWVRSWLRQEYANGKSLQFCGILTDCTAKLAHDRRTKWKCDMNEELVRWRKSGVSGEEVTVFHSSLDLRPLWWAHRFYARASSILWTWWWCNVHWKKLK